MPKTIQQIFGMKRRAKDVGLELETEFKNEFPVVKPEPILWNQVVDGSLRHSGVEFVARVPFAADEFTLKTALTNLIDAVNQEGSAIPDSPRTSFHVHCNVQNLTSIQVTNACVAWWLLEPLLMKYCGEDREGHLFCLRLQDSEQPLMVLEQAAAAAKNSQLLFNNFMADNHKYAALNLATVRTVGSLEFRGMRGVLDADILRRWTMCVHGIVSKAKVFADPASVMDHYLECTPSQFLESFVEDKEILSFVKAVPHWQELLDTNTLTLFQLAYEVDWNKLKAADEDLTQDDLRDQVKPVALKFNDLLRARDALANAQPVQANEDF